MFKMLKTFKMLNIMVLIPDMYKIYMFMLICIGIGYYGALDSKNFLILGIPALLFFKSIQFDFTTKEKNANIVSIAKDVFNLKNNWSENDSNEIKFYLQNLIKSIATKNIQKEE
jgi:hypothetical protein